MARRAAVATVVVIALGLWFTGRRGAEPSAPVPDAGADAGAGVRAAPRGGPAPRPRTGPAPERSAPRSDAALEHAVDAEAVALTSPEPPDEDHLPAVTVWPATPEGIRGAVMESVALLRDCYEEALDEVPELSGDLRIRFAVDDVDGVGRVQDLGVTAGALEDPPMEDCVLDVFEDLQFDPPAEGALEVTYPVKFTTE